MADLSHDPSVDLSAAAYSRKKSAELQRIRDSKSKRESVAKIIEKMNEKGIGGVSLNGVHVEAFIHKQVEESGMEVGSAGHAEAYERALKAALAHAESGEFDGGIGGQGGRGGGDHRVDGSDRSGGRGAGVRGMTSSFTGASSSGDGGGDGGSPTNASMEAYLSQAFASARGLHGDEWKAGRDVHGYKSPDDHADAEANEYVVPGAGELRVEKAEAAAAAKAREGARAFRSAVGDAKGGTEKSPEERAYEARMRRNLEGNADKGEGVYKEAVTPKEKATKYQRGSRTIGRENDAPQASGRLSPERTFDASRVGVDPLTATAYSANATHNVPYSARKLQNAGMGEGGNGEESPQKDVEEVVEDMADRQARRLAASAEAGTEEVHVPEKDEAEVEYEAKMKAMREEARRENAERPAGAAVHVPSEAVAEMEMADEEMKKKLVKEPKVQESGPPEGEDGSAAGGNEGEEDGEGDEAEAEGDEVEGEAEGDGEGEAEVDSGEANDNDEAKGNAGADDNDAADDNGAVDTPADGEFDDFMAVLAASEHEGEGDAAPDESADADEELGKEGAEGATVEENDNKGGDVEEDVETEVVEEAEKESKPEVPVEQKPAETTDERKTTATAKKTVDAADVQVPEAAAGCCCVIL